MIPAELLACAPNVAPVTIEAVVRVESGGNPLAVNVNRLRGRQPRPASVAEAVRVAQGYIARGYSVDLGLMQVNSRNLPALGLTIAQAFDPCTSIRGGAAVLTADYAEAARRMGEGQIALRAALSAYNTGSFTRGVAYVARYYAPGGVPALAGGVQVATAAASRRTPAARAAAAAPNPYTADTAVDLTEASDVRFGG